MTTELQSGRNQASGLVDVLDRVLDKGLVIADDIKVSLAQVELLTIAETDQRKIFEDFRQADDPVTRQYGGAGLGFSICPRLASMLEGRITVDSKLGAGSTFTLHVPRQGRRP